jgi:hypothetical protein
VIAKMDLVEVEDGAVTPVDYKHGNPREGAGGLELWPSDRAQLAVQGLVLRENGYRCEEGIVYYRKTGQRVRVAFDAAVMAEAEALIARAWETARAALIPEPLVDSPKCPGCSLVGICLPDETGFVHESEFAEEPQQLGLFDTPRRKPVKREVRPLVTPRSELRPLYLNSQGFRVGKSGAVLQVKDKEKVVQEVRRGRDQSGEPDGERADLDAGGAGAVRERRADLLLLDGRVVLRDHDGDEHRRTYSCGGASSGCRTRSISRGRWRGSWWRGRFAIRERCCSGIMWSRRSRRWRV